MEITAEDKNMVIEILKSNPGRGRLDAAKYLHQKYACKLVSTLQCVTSIKLELENNTGTITWIKCEDQLPPIDDEQDKESKYVLIWQNGMNPVTGKYNYEISRWLHWSHWEPTHWAAINFPE